MGNCQQSFRKDGLVDLKLWIDDVRPAPEGYVWCKGVNMAKAIIIDCRYKEVKFLTEAVKSYNEQDLDYYYIFSKFAKDYIIELIDIDHDAGEYADQGGDYIKLLNWLEETGRNYPIRIHSANPVGVVNMRRIIQKNNWKEVF